MEKLISNINLALNDHECIIILSCPCLKGLTKQTLCLRRRNVLKKVEAIFTLLTSSYTCCYTHAHHTYPPACTHSHTHSPSPPHSLTHASPALAHAQSHTVLQPSTQAWACASAAVRTLCPAWMPMCLESGDYC